MLVKYWKSFKWFLFVPLILFVFFFNFKNVSAYIYKSDVYTSYTQNRYTGTLTSSNATLTFNFSEGVPKANYDYLVFKFGNFKFKYVDDFNTSNPTTYCSNYTINTASSNQNGDFEYWPTSMSCYTTSSSGSSSDTLATGNFYMQIRMFYGSNFSPCYMSSELENFVICPFNANYGNATGLELQIQNGGYQSIVYDISLNGTKYYFNNDNTEIITNQNTTNTNLQYIYQYQQNDSVSGSTTQATTDFSDLAQSFNSELAGVNDLSQLVLLPISLFMDLSTDNCQPLHLVVPFVNTSVDLPCMKAIFNTYFYGFYTIFTTIMSAIICYWVAIKTGSLIKDIVDCDNDRIEVIEL